MVRKVAPIGVVKKQRNRELGATRMLITALDYIGSGHDLTCTVDGKNMESLARASGITDVTVAVNEQCTKANVSRLIQSVAARCQPYDTFIFNYSGHGTTVTDTDGDEDDNQDEAFVFVDEQGNINLDSSLMTDDEFSALIMQALPPTATFICIADCCHSGSITDFARPGWRGRKAISISGCRDTQTSGDTGNGGICTHALLLAVQSMQQMGLKQYSVGKLFGEIVRKDDEVFASPQDITLDRTKAASQNDIIWPLIPKTNYKAPYQNNVAAPNSNYTTGPAPNSNYTTGPAPNSTYTTGPVSAPCSMYTTTAPVAPYRPNLNGSASSYLLPNPGGSAQAPAAYVVSGGSLQLAPAAFGVAGGSVQAPVTFGVAGGSITAPFGSAPAPVFTTSNATVFSGGSQVMPGTSYITPSGSQVLQGTSYVMPSGGPGGQYIMQPTQAPGYSVQQPGNPAGSYGYPMAVSTPQPVVAPPVYVSAVSTPHPVVAPPVYVSAPSYGMSPIFSPRGSRLS